MNEAWIKLLKADPERQMPYKLKPQKDPITGEETRTDAPTQIPHVLQREAPQPYEDEEVTRYHQHGNNVYPMTDTRQVRRIKQEGEKSDRNRPIEGYTDGLHEGGPDDETGRVSDRHRQRIQARTRPNEGLVDDFNRQQAGGQRAATSGFQSKPYGMFRNRRPKMGPAGLPPLQPGQQSVFDIAPQFRNTLQNMNIKTGFPMSVFQESWGTLLKESMCKGDDCKGCRGCKTCPKCKPEGSTCEKRGCA